MKKNKILALIFPVLALILELLPNGVTMRFGAPPGEPPLITKTSYFDLLPMGYANFGPLVTAILTIVLLITLLLCMVKSYTKLWNTGKIISLIAAIISLIPILFSSYTIIGGAISVCLFAEFIYLGLKKPTDTDKG